MLRYLSLRMLYTLPAVWLVVSIVFLLIHFVPGDPILQMLGEGAPAADVEATRHAYGLDLPLGQQYLHYWKGVLRGDLGPSLRFNQSVSKMIAQRYPYTLELTLASRSEEHTSELQSRPHLVCRLLLVKKKKVDII